MESIGIERNIGKKWAKEQYLHIFFISNLVAKAPGLNLGKKLSNFLRSFELVANILYIFPKQWTREIYVSGREESLKVSKQKERIQYDTMYVMLKWKLQIESQKMVSILQRLY